MSGIEEADSKRKGVEYRGSPAPFAFFLVLFLVFLVLAVLSFPYPAIEPQKYILPVFFGIFAFVSLVFLPATVAITRSGRRRLYYVSGSFRGLWGLVSSLSGHLRRVF